MGAVVANKGSEELGSGAFDAATHVFAKATCAGCDLFDQDCKTREATRAGCWLRKAS